MAYIKKYKVDCNGRTSYVSNYFSRHIRPEELLCDDERDLLAIAKLLIWLLVALFIFIHHVATL